MAVRCRLDAQLEERRPRAGALRARGWTFAKIAAEWVINYTTAERDASNGAADCNHFATIQVETPWYSPGWWSGRSLIGVDVLGPGWYWLG
jgi:hypothetical protein